MGGGTHQCADAEAGMEGRHARAACIRSTTTPAAFIPTSSTPTAAPRPAMVTPRASTEPAAPTALLYMPDELALTALGTPGSWTCPFPVTCPWPGSTTRPRPGWAEPALTTVRQDLVDKGRIAGQLCLDLLAGSRPSKPTLLDVELVVRGSTGTAAR
jgi:hypothetical protein